MRVFIFLLTALFATTAQATPPQTIEVSETLLGVNDTHLFVLRRMDDNMGRYQITQTDVVLIARNRETNQDDQIWPVMRMIDSGYNADERGIEAQINPLALKTRVNPFDILLWRNARPLMAMLGTFRKENTINNLREHGMLTIVSDGDNYRLADDVMARLLSSSLYTTRAAMPPYFVEGGYDALLGIEVDPARECKYHDFTRFYEQVDQGFQDFWIAYVTCESDEAMSYLSMFLMIPKQD